MADSTPLVMQARALRDRLALSGDHPMILAKLNHIVDKAYVNPAEREKLKNLIRQARGI